jgi:DNA-binding NarL/FixJ family response regulator
MNPVPLPPKSEHLNLGGPQRVLLVADPAPLLLRLAEVVRSFPGLELAGMVGTAQDAIDWAVWDRGSWHLAFVDLNLPQGGTQDVVRRLLSQPRPGTVVALGAHLWKETRAECAQMGIHHLLEKGDIVAFRSFLEEQVG